MPSSNLQILQNSGASTVFEKGMSSAKNSFEKVLNSPMALQELNFKKCEYNLKTVAKDANFYAVSSELMGEFIGESILIFSEEEVENMIKKCLDEKYWSSETNEQATMRNEFITEVDNIVSSAVVTEIADALNVHLVGGAPKLTKLNAKELNTYIRFQASTYDSVIHFKAIFEGQELAITPNFIWMFNEQIIEKIAS